MNEEQWLEASQQPRARGGSPNIAKQPPPVPTSRGRIMKTGALLLQPRASPSILMFRVLSLRVVKVE